jgi:hypothetical protein
MCTTWGAVLPIRVVYRLPSCDGLERRAVVWQEIDIVEAEPS